jgi:hypothetical protein
MLWLVACTGCKAATSETTTGFAPVAADVRSRVECVSIVRLRNPFELGEPGGNPPAAARLSLFSTYKDAVIGVSLSAHEVSRIAPRKGTKPKVSFLDRLPACVGDAAAVHTDVATVEERRCSAAKRHASRYGL